MNAHFGVITNLPQADAIAANLGTPTDTFGQKVKQAAERKAGTTTTKKQHAEQAAKEGARYLHKPRPRTKSD
jgi:hypothetical protein